MVVRTPQRNQTIGSLAARLLSRVALAFVLSCTLLAILPGCGSADSSSSAQAAPAPAKKSAPKKSSDASGAAYKLPAEVKVPKTTSSSAPLIDVDGVDDGYVCAAAQSSSRLKFQVKCGDAAYNYDMPNDGTPALFPVNMGSGSYGFRIMENVEGSSYAELEAAYLDVDLKSEFAPFLVPNIFCSYNTKSKCVAKARDLVKSSENEGEVVREVCTFVAKAITYDYDKAEVLAKSSGYIPDPDSTLAEGKGVCFDYAALTAAMLRSLGMPTKVITGYVSPDDLYHAWIMVYINGTWESVLFSVKPNTWSRCDVTFASAGVSSVTGNGTTYTDRYTY